MAWGSPLKSFLLVHTQLSPSKIFIQQNQPHYPHTCESVFTSTHQNLHSGPSNTLLLGDLLVATVGSQRRLEADN